MLKKTKILHKVLVLSLVLLVFIFLVGSVGYLFNRQANQKMAQIYEENLKPIQFLNDTRIQIGANEAGLLSIIQVSNDMEKQAIYIDEMAKRGQRINANWISYKKGNHESENSLKNLSIQWVKF
jgi:predicted PurR-regulated permease PerM